MIKTKEELLSQIREVIGEDNNSDDVISLIENVTDTYADFEDKTRDDWRGKYEESERSWREKYISRFGEDAKEPEEKHSDPNENPVPKTFESLFKTE